MKRMRLRNGFTLVEILIVVVILGILAAIVVPGIAGATEDASISATSTELEKLRRAVEVYKASNNDAVPPVTAGDGTWDVIVSRAYLKEAPVNPYVGGANAGVIVIGEGPDEAYQTGYGWIFSATTGDIWAGGFDADDEPLPR
ncbi:MAG: type II secretion system protein [Phycisphaerales bacterium]